MKYILYFVIGYVVLYAAVWLHEVGHALWDYLFRLRKDWWRVQVKPYIFFSTPGPVDADRYYRLKPYQHVLGAYGGLMANAIFAAAAWGVISLVGDANEYLRMALWLFMTLHLGEIVSYLFIGSIYLVSDMAIVDQYAHSLRLPNIIMGADLTVLYVYLLSIVPEEFRLFVIVWNVITVLSMCIGRIVFTARAKKRNSQAASEESREEEESQEKEDSKEEEEPPEKESPEEPTEA